MIPSYRCPSVPDATARLADDCSAFRVSSYRCSSVCIGGSKSGVYDAGAQSTTTTNFSYNNANELTSSSTGGTTTNYAYDAWGRQTSKTQGDYSCTYAYRYGDKLYSVTSNFPNEGNLTYQYGADHKRRERTAGGTTTKYRWDLGWNMINQENSEGTLTMTYVMNAPMAEVAGMLADLSGTNPATGTARYYLHDNLGSTRRLRGADRSSLGVYEYEPYGSIYAQSGVSLGDLGGAFTGKSWDGAAQLYYFPYRYYSPDLARWLTRDPLGMVGGPNLYEYVKGSPITLIDPKGDVVDWILVFTIIGAAAALITALVALITFLWPESEVKVETIPAHWKYSYSCPPGYKMEMGPMVDSLTGQVAYCWCFCECRAGSGSEACPHGYSIRCGETREWVPEVTKIYRSSD